MPAKLNGHTTWDAKAKERRESDAQTLYETYSITSDDTIRFPKAPGSTAKVTGKALSVGADGSVTCSAGGRLRAIVPEKIEVKMRGPRGGVNWVPLVPEKG
jgi:hypothetical protein